MLLLCICLNLFISGIHAASKSSVDSLINAYNTTTIDSIRMIQAISIGQKLLDVDVTTALNYLQKAYDLMCNGVEYSSHKSSRAESRCSLLNLMSLACNRVGEVERGLNFRMQQLEEARKSGERKLEQYALGNLASAHETQGNFSEALKYQYLALQLALEENNPYQIGLAYGNLGSVFDQLKNMDSATYYYAKSIPFLMQIQNNKEAKFGAMGWMMNNMGDVFFKKGNLDSAFYFYHLSKQYREGISHTLGKFLIYSDLAKVHNRKGNSDSAFYYINKSISLGRANGFVDFLDNSFKLRSEMFRNKGKYKEALDDYVQSIQLRDSIVNVENAKSILRQSMKYEHKLSKLADSLDYAQKEAVLTERTQKQRLGLIATAGSLILLFTLAYSIYKGKKRSDELLLNILPGETAEELKRKGHADAKFIDEATVIFTDFKGFTAFAEKLSPDELVKDLNECFSAFDQIVEKHGLEKIKTIGDAYMAAGGLPTHNKTHATDAIRAALEMRDFIEILKSRKSSSGMPFFEIRIGIHTGPVVAGIVGIKKFQYDIWGDTVNTASRMESSGEPGKINISETTYDKVKDQFHCDYRGEIEAKGKGKIKMYFVERRFRI